MDKITRTHLDNIRSKDRELQNKAFSYLLESTKKTVDWIYEAWDELVAGLSDKDNHVRAIASQILANLAKSDPEKRMLRDFDALVALTKDGRFVTARHCMQSIWKVGAAGKEQQKMLVDSLERRNEGLKSVLRRKTGALSATISFRDSGIYMTRYRMMESRKKPWS